MESAAGLAGVIKVLLQMKYKTIVPSLHAENINPHLNIEDTPFYLAKFKQDWINNSAIPRRALINSFGAGGANASIIIDDCESVENDSNSYALSYYIIPISARSFSSLQGQLDQLRIWLKNYQDNDLALRTNR